MYKIVYKDNVNKETEGIIGGIYDGDTLLMQIIHKKNDYKKYKYRMRAIIHEISDDFQIAEIIISANYIDIAIDKPKVFEALAYHELGHYINGDLEIKDKDTKAIMEERFNCIREGKVLENERKADEFAVKIVGKSRMINAIDYLIKLRKERNDSISTEAIKEFNIRKKCIKNFNV